MQVNIQPNEQETIVQLIGQLNTIATTDHAEELQQVLDIADKALVIDCSELEYNSYCESDGLLYFGGYGGVVKVDPASMKAVSRLSLKSPRPSHKTVNLQVSETTDRLRSILCGRGVPRRQP